MSMRSRFDRVLRTLDSFPIVFIWVIRQQTAMSILGSKVSLLDAVLQEFRGRV